MRDVLVIYNFVTTWFLKSVYDVGQASGMRYVDFCDRAGKAGSGYWTNGHQVHQQRHDGLIKRLTPNSGLPSRGSLSERRSIPRPDAGGLVGAALAFLRERHGFGAEEECDFLTYTCQDLEAHASPPPGIPIDPASLYLYATAAVEDIRAMELERVISGESPSGLSQTYTVAARLARDGLRAELDSYRAAAQTD